MKHESTVQLSEGLWLVLLGVYTFVHIAQPIFFDPITIIKLKLVWKEVEEIQKARLEAGKEWLLKRSPFRVKMSLQSSLAS